MKSAPPGMYLVSLLSIPGLFYFYYAINRGRVWCNGDYIIRTANPLGFWAYIVAQILLLIFLFLTPFLPLYGSA